MEISRRAFLGLLAVSSPIARSAPSEGGSTTSRMAYSDVSTYPVFAQADIAKALKGDEGQRMEMSGNVLKG
jgi:hypothetical protein